MIGFLAIFAAVMSGLSGLGVWAVAASAIALCATSYSEHYQLYERGRELGLVEETRSTLLRSLINGLLTCSGAYCGGLLLRLLNG